ncbi:DegT/DnrJ/EryC1/StrS family aminotransferase [Bradyrhizobium sp. U87765 SZCCT0131]|uniref:DegT/DnrJ/EryC1/StrS family aminotransferase n=1 Tax=unclassified Bradyrhizobium TaxID=2631580 RepID=UPI001BAD6BCD|nr:MULTISPECIES: DegT/DnrJ/EryC1/StrS family aminotransferase [unclassified Bradyrhizobium]MBR1219671.1 DegT/DnrJ/EryC1/StrS family aminotransferase [Bradyrhizobium sp. U87765 SZCCT0131]MBR1262322.1 DegT/DnrJ/EryC1/StrS family aminotransferase [Bradyrhizobium sp. U87765 SZCCT0134]MBR1308495.1 DegT/DnrJ/EryC1/StrS family aminotransferase [Bradyrhizobium sp. U87765 SZCCT0110]MBR1318104.1 DegT/DnrJ/EryC1/StrS family aminotransferase [Bradyrhizobium sp. U87765 SZCCT0109]MBR1351807.1 DegT/DnrJ/EryC
MTRPLYVTRPVLPELSDYQALLADIWRSKILTNGGPLHQRLERELEQYLGVPTAMLFNNGTIALLAALKLLKLPAGSEVITTPLTFAATAHAIKWNGLEPVFADVLPGTLTLDPEAVRKAITPKTSAILGVHVYGTVCELDALQKVADDHGLRLLYDAAHVFGTTVNGVPIGCFGDASVFSFHATKLFNTAEGGLVATNRALDKESIYFIRNFGIKNEEEVVDVGINGKLSEFSAAMGLLVLPLVDDERARRSVLRQKYAEFLTELPGIELAPAQPGVTQSEQYFRVSIDQGAFGRSRDDIYAALQKRQIFSRKYFHPICTDFESYRGYPIYSTRNLPYVERIKSQVLCLPFHGEVEDEDLAEIRDVFSAR